MSCMHLFICILGNFTCFIKIYIFPKMSLEYHQHSNSLIQIRPDILSRLIWIHKLFAKPPVGKKFNHKIIIGAGTYSISCSEVHLCKDIKS